MFKFKMSLLLQNVKFRVAVAVLVIATMVAGIVFIPKNKANNTIPAVEIKAVETGVKVAGVNYCTIEKLETARKYAGFNSVFCVQEEEDLGYHGFFQKDIVDISSAQQNFSNYNSARWLINNMYIANAGNGDFNSKYVLASNLAYLLTSDSVKAEVSKLGFDGSNVTPQKIINLRDKSVGGENKQNALEIVEQFALWRYTNNKGTTVSSAYRNNPNQFLDGANLTDDEQRTLKYTYYALTVLADKNANTQSSNTISNPITLNKSQAVYNENTGKVGPYYIEENGIKWTSVEFGAVEQGKLPVTIEVTNVDGSKQSLNADAIEKNADGSFYINVAQYKNNIKQVYFRVSYIATEINTKAVVANGGNGNQNIMDVEKTVKAASVTDTKTIEVKVPEGMYNVTLKKVKEDGTTVITTSEATFKINGTEITTVNGKLALASGKNIENANQVDTYEIIETKAPEGYTGYNGTMKLNVKFKEVNKVFMIDRDNTTTEGFANGAKVEIAQDNANITITVPNKEIPKPGVYNVELYKVDDNGAIITTPAKFEINGKEAKTENGRIVVASNVQVNDDTTVGKYTIKETGAPENYNLFDGTITLNVKMTKSGNTYVLNENGITFNVDKENEGVTYKLEGSTIKIYVPNTHKVFDLSLRKFITKIDGVVVVPSREPVITVQSIINLQLTGTASYYHDKNSLGVHLGSEVEYTIRVYNEGEILSYAKQITDYLPEGLTFLRIADESKALYTTDSQVGSRVVVINYQGNTLIKSLTDFYTQIVNVDKNVKLNVTNEYYQEVKIICKVEQTNATYITSRSEITNYGYAETNEQGTVVWKEAKAVGNVDRDSVQGTIVNQLNLDTWYENAEERTYVDQSGKTVVDTKYFPGVQDDDDFETVELLTGKYNIIIRKVDAADEKTTLPGAYFSIKASKAEKATEVGPTGNNGEVAVIKGVQIQNEKQVDEYTIKETKAPKAYKGYDGDIKVKVATKFDGNNFVIDSKNTTVNGKDVKFSVNKENTTLTVVVPNVKKEYDLALRKFITDVNGEKIKESREPQVDVSKLASGESTTATYKHPKNPVDVNTTDVVTYTFRSYNEGEIDGIAKKVMDSIPEGLEFLPENDLNKEYKWVMYKEVKDKTANTVVFDGKNYEVTKKASEADIIVTDYIKDAVIKAFDGKTLDYKDVKANFKVVEPNTSDRILTNYAQIAEQTDSEGNKVTDRDSNANQWIEGEDDQDIEKVKVRYFDLALRKGVTKAIVYENGVEKVTETKHDAWDDPEPVVKVDLLNTNINNVTVKFEYTIRVYNQGDKEGAVEGYAKKVTDYIPEGLKFVQEDNPQWTIEDGKYVTRALENTLLKPGEYADVKILLTWVNGADNLGLKTNVAEISEDYNQWGTKDIDSTPDNQVPGEDDIDDAPVILAVRTGTPIVYTGVAVAAIAIVSLGVVFIRRKVMA